jgi:hypothetical protein
MRYATVRGQAEKSKAREKILFSIGIENKIRLLSIAHIKEPRQKNDIHRYN